MVRHPPPLTQEAVAGALGNGQQVVSAPRVLLVVAPRMHQRLLDRALDEHTRQGGGQHCASACVCSRHALTHVRAQTAYTTRHTHGRLTDTHNLRTTCVRPRACECNAHPAEGGPCTQHQPSTVHPTNACVRRPHTCMTGSAVSVGSSDAVVLRGGSPMVRCASSEGAWTGAAAGGGGATGACGEAPKA